MLGKHMVKSWSSSQLVVALSSSEAELYALVKVATQAKGISSLLQDFGMTTDITIHTDSTAALGIVHRKGLGKTRHIVVQWLWIQENVHDKSMSVRKVGTQENPPDMSTEGQTREKLNEHVQFVGGHIYEKRDRSALAINSLGLSDSWEFKNGNVMVRKHVKLRKFVHTHEGCWRSKIFKISQRHQADDWQVSKRGNFYNLQRLVSFCGAEAWSGHIVFIVECDGR